jgi:hypothetical protein
MLLRTESSQLWIYFHNQDPQGHNSEFRFTIVILKFKILNFVP